MADDQQMMVMAGLWAKWKSPKGEEVLSCTVLTLPRTKSSASCTTACR
jgi:putative SOS response-associated peptidase YedK